MLPQRRRFRELLGRAGPIMAPGVYDCLTARLVEQAGFEAAMTTGAGLAASLLGAPDVGLLTMSEVLNQTRNIARGLGIPIVADCDTGYGNPINAMRTVREFEAAGVAALFIEDQVSPKKCGHFEGKQIISRAAMAAKIRAAVEARSDPELIVMARTDAIAVEGLEEALRRAEAYVEAGAEMLFVEAPRTLDELAEVGRRLEPLGVPLMVNLVEGGRTPLADVASLHGLGFKLITFSGSLQRTAIAAMQGFLESLRETGSVGAYFPSRMVDLDTRSRILGLDDFYELERRFADE
jgi:2-methylisocitrate lyase-like PEP mutase family enzyme